MRALVSLAALVLLVVLASACGSGGSQASGTPPLIVGVVASLAGGAAAEAGQGAVVAVVDAATGSPIPGAVVTVNGVRLPYVPANEDYEAAVRVARGAGVTLTVSVGGNTYSAAGTQVTTFPEPALPAPGAAWPSGCPNTVTWSRGSPEAGGSYMVLVMDASSPAAPALVDQTLSTTLTSYEIPANTVSVGERILVVGLAADVPVASAASGSRLVLVGGTAAAVSVSSADYSRIDIYPGNLGMAPGQVQQLRATGALCRLGGFTVDLTDVADWGSSVPSVATVGNAPGTRGLATATNPGTTVVTATSQGISGHVALGVRPFTVRDSGDMSHMLTAVTWTGAELVAVGVGGTILDSPDGVTWTTRASGSPNTIVGVAGSPDALVATMYSSGSVLWSPDLSTWTTVPTPASDTLHAVAWGGGQFVAVGANGVVLASPDGLSWTARSSGLAEVLTGVAWSGSRYVAVGGSTGPLGGSVLTSPDGVTWTSQAVPPGTPFLRGVAWSRGQFIAVGDGEAIASPDGVAWTTRSGAGFMSAIAGSDAGFAAVGAFGEVVTSGDGAAWLPFHPTDARLNGVAFFGSSFVVVGGLGLVLTSP